MDNYQKQLDQSESIVECRSQPSTVPDLIYSSPSSSSSSSSSPHGVSLGSLFQLICN